MLQIWRKSTILQSLLISALTPCAAEVSKSFSLFPTTSEPTRRRKVPLLAGIQLSPPDLPQQVLLRAPDLITMSPWTLEEPLAYDQGNLHQDLPPTLLLSSTEAGIDIYLPS